MAGIEAKNLGQADEVDDYGTEGKSERVTLGMTGMGLGSESTVWRSTLLPGWSWMRNIKPRVPFEICPLPHREYVISGRIRYTMADGTFVDGNPGDHLMIDPGHLAEVVGDEACVLLDW
jgi:hypothetical protein